MNPVVASSLISGGLGLLGSIGGNIFNAVSTTNTNSAQRRLAQEQRDWNYDMWMKENRWNSPSHQMQMLSQAGLNPSLMYGEGAGGLPQSASISPYEVARLSAPQVNPMELAQIANITAQTAKIKAETRNLQTEGEGLQIDNFFKSFQKDFVEANSELIKENARMSVLSGIAENETQYYQAIFAGEQLCSILGYDQDEGYFVYAHSYIDHDVREKLRQLGLSSLEQTRLERALYKSYYEAQLEVNEKAKEEAKMEAVIPAMINNCPKWLQPILILAKTWLTQGHMPGFSVNPKTTNVTNNSTTNTDQMLFFGGRKKQ